MHTLPTGCMIYGTSSLNAPLTWTGDVAGTSVVVEALRLIGVVVEAVTGRAAAGMRLALRAHPVRARSACLKFRT